MFSSKKSLIGIMLGSLIIILLSSVYLIEFSIETLDENVKFNQQEVNNVIRISKSKNNNKRKNKKTKKKSYKKSIEAQSDYLQSGIQTRVNLEQLFNSCKDPDENRGYLWVRMMKTGTTSQVDLFEQATENCYNSMAKTFVSYRTNHLNEILERFNKNGKKKFNCHPKWSNHLAYNKTFAEKYLNPNIIKITGMRHPLRRAISASLVRMNYGPDDLNSKIYRKSCYKHGEKDFTLKEYFSNCSRVIDNYYLRMLDPKTRQISTATEALRDFVIFNVDDHKISWDILRRVLCLKKKAKKEKSKNVTNSTSIADLNLDLDDMKKLIAFTEKDTIIYESSLILYNQLKTQYLNYIEKYEG